MLGMGVSLWHKAIPGIGGGQSLIRPTLVAKKVVSIAGGTSATTVPLTSGWNTTYGSATYTPAQNDIVIVTYCVAATADIAIGVNTAGYAELAELFGDDNSDTNLSVSWKRMGATPDTEIELSQTTSILFGGIAIIEVWSPVNTTTAIDVATTTATGTNGGQPNPPAITPTTEGAVVIVCGGAAWTGDALAAFTQSGSELAGFLSDVNLASTRDAAVGTGYYEWESGAFDPAAWTGGSTDAASSNASASLVLRPV